MTNEEIKVVLSPKDRNYMNNIIAETREEIAQKKYARAWSTLKTPRFWEYWKEFLEKASKGIARLPDKIKIKSPAASKKIRTLKAVKTKSPIIINGRLDESDWNKTDFSGHFTDFKLHKPAMNDTALKAMYDDKALYIGFICADRDPDTPKAEAKEEMGVFASKDDALAIFIQPDESIPLYYQLAFNANGVRFDQRVKSGKKDYAFRPEWRAKGAKGKNYWTAEVMIPFEELSTKKVDDTKWRINFGRVMHDNLVDPSEWNPTDGNWHATEYFGRLEFEK